MLLFRKREVLLPTWRGWAVISALALSCAVLFLAYAEAFLAVTDDQGSDALVVECWIGARGIESAGELFLSKNYRYIVLVGGIEETRWTKEFWNHTEYSKEVLQKAFPEILDENIVLASNDFVLRNRTYRAALKAELEIRARELEIKSLSLFTKGAHARRSKLVYRRAFPDNIEIRSASWKPARLYEGKWFSSSERTKDLLVEMIGYVYEKLFYSGRWF